MGQGEFNRRTDPHKSAHLVKIIWKKSHVATSSERKPEFYVWAKKEDYQKWKQDKSIPLAQVVDSFKVFTVSNHSGNEGISSQPSKDTLKEIFGTTRDDDVVKFILENGHVH
ncbi:hypothetical protein MP638_000648 [Amoeboaphelidium occidentale]|jgi:ribosome maturation protein Sdo1|nr:hypothetical protein MP638_000648 [Amoeboaphelidium occidentale]